MTAVRPLPVDLLALFGRILWGYESGDGSIGASSLTDRETFIAAIRALRDDLLGLIADPETRYAIRAPAQSDPVGPYFEQIWGDLLRTDSRGERAVSIEPGRRVADSGRTGRLAPGRLIVVLGAARSGTTWLHRLLSAHPAVAGTEVGETWLFPDVVPVWDALAERVPHEPLVAAVRAFCDRLLAAMRDRENATAGHVCEKTPATVWRLPMMAELYPDAHYVHIVRDGRDAALSMSRAGGGRADLAAAAHAWVAAVGEVRDNAGLLPQLREVRYEDLLAEPAAVVRDLWQWIGLDVSAEGLAAASRRSRQRITPLAAVGEIGTGKWQSLPESDRLILAEVEGSLLERLGYR